MRRGGGEKGTRALGTVYPGVDERRLRGRGCIVLSAVVVEAT